MPRKSNKQLALDEYRRWIRVIADSLGGRPHFSDQTPESLYLLGQLVEIYKPTVIIECGTSHGMSTRLFKQKAPTTLIHCIDSGFTLLRNSLSALPLEIGGLLLHECWLDQVKLEDLWTDSDKVLIYADVHSQHQHIFNAVPKLPDGMVVWDDVWYSPDLLDTPEKQEAFLRDVITPQVDIDADKAIWPMCWQRYWKGGTFWGFPEVDILCKWAETNKVKLHWEEGVKVAWFQWPHDKA